MRFTAFARSTAFSSRKDDGKSQLEKRLPHDANLQPRASWLFQTPRPKIINGATPNPNSPRLSIGMAFKQPFGRSYKCFIDLKISGFDVDRHKFVFISSFNLLTNARLIEFLPTSSYLFFAVTSLADCHKFNPIGNCHFHFSWFHRFCWVSLSVQPTD
jgi:hypothetical protein